MNIKDIKTLTIILFIIGFLIIVIFYLNLSKENQNIINFVSIFGTFLSLFGIIITFLQLQNLKQINTKTQEQVKNSIEKINDVLSISELSKSIKIIQEIQTYLHGQKSELCLIRMKDLKQILIQIKHNINLSNFTENEDYKKSIVDLSIDINNISDSILKPNRPVNFSKINSNLEELSTKLSDFENQLKFN